MITYAALSPHPPLIIPEIGGARIEDVASTVAGMQNMARELVESKPDTLVFLTPHGNVFSDCLSALAEPRLEGDFTPFGNSWGTSCANDLEFLAEIGKNAAREGVPFLQVSRETAKAYRLNTKLDHGILVPLYYLKEAGLPEIPILAISIGYLSIFELYTFGTLIRDAGKSLGKRAALIASGDMSHRLKNEGPYDYHPDGLKFDEAVRNMLACGDRAGITNMPEKLRENAGECGYRSIVIMLGAVDGQKTEARIFSYEGPFGVGYLTAGILPGADEESFLQRMKEEKEEKISARRSQESLPVRWARMILESHINKKGNPSLPGEMDELRGQRAGAFVSLKKNGQLRGCIGTISPTRKDLAAEIAANAISAGTGDPRFLPVGQHELGDLVYSVDILGEAEPCQEEDLDPRKFGVIVSKGSKRGLLLPDLEGVDTVKEQLSIALQKAGISSGEGYSIERFEVKRFT
ncbi:MAG: AmmeMemoRadiSam system protein A [Syntrophomonas sp.]